MENTGVFFNINFDGTKFSLEAPSSLSKLLWQVARQIKYSKPVSNLNLFHNDRLVKTMLSYKNLLESPGELNILIKEKENLWNSLSPSIMCISKNYIMWYTYSLLPGRLENLLIPSHSVCFTFNKSFPRIICADQHWEFNTSSYTIIRKAPMQTCRYYFASILIEDFIYTFGGVNKEGYTTDSERYSYETDTWTYIENCPLPGRSGMSTANWANLYIFLFGGFDGLEYSSKIDKYCIYSGDWYSISLSLPIHTQYLGAFETGRGILLFGGKNNKDYYLFSPEEEIIIKLGALTNAVPLRFSQNPILINSEYFIVNQSMNVLQYDLDSESWKNGFDFYNLNEINSNP
ncbi:unnamed protein product [Blepharisma stoltei]|uniref:Uncharacterized protein n=1 Tax=Blepharisma stoltei TaxID=1481888 RepID=A0AAU9K6Z9_9CILI|nr:unnamed protein product [Blepharisma stoltei]